MLESRYLTTASPVPFPLGCPQIYSPSSSQCDRFKKHKLALVIFLLKTLYIKCFLPSQSLLLSAVATPGGFQVISWDSGYLLRTPWGGHCFLPGGFSKCEATKKPEAKDKILPTLILSAQPFWESRFILFRRSREDTGEGNGNPLQCSCLENPRDGGAWWAAVYGFVQSRTRLKRLSSSSSSSSRKDTIPW